MTEVGLGDLLPFVPLLERLADAILDRPNNPGQDILGEVVELLRQEVELYSERTEHLEDEVVQLHERVAYLEGLVDGLDP